MHSVPFRSQMMEYTNEKVTQHVAVCAFPFATHAPPLLLFVQRIAAAAPHVRFTFFSTDQSNAKLFRDADGVVSPIRNIVPHAVHDGVPDGHVPSHPVEAVGLFLRSGEENLRKSIAEAEEEVGVEISCLVTDAFLWFCQKIAADKGGRWVPLWTSGAAALSAHFHTDLFRDKVGKSGSIEGHEDDAADFVPGFSAVRLGDLPQGVVSGDLNNPFSKMLHGMALTLPKATAIAINTVEELEPEITTGLKEQLKNLVSVGPLFLTSPQQTLRADEYGCIPWLEGREPASVAYISFGSTATPPPNEVQALAEALEESKVDFIWSMNDAAKERLPEGFLERTERKGKVVAWAPQLALLAHPAVGVFVTHGGWNSILESIVSGVPMIVRPFFGDHMLNRRVIEAVWEIGVGVEGGVFTKIGAMGALDRVLRGEEGTEMRERLERLKLLAKEATKSNGSSTRYFPSLIDTIVVAGKPV